MKLKDNLTRKWIPGITLLGAVLVIFSTFLHPITVDPWNADLPIHFISENRLHWMWDHSLMAIAIILWLGGLAACFCLFNPRHQFSIIVVALYISSIAMWLVTLALELGGMPISVERIQLHSDPLHRSLAESLFASALILGYLAMIPAWLGVTLGAQSKWGIFSGCIGLSGIIYCLFNPTVWILVVTSAFPFVWTIIFARWCWRKT